MSARPLPANRRVRPASADPVETPAPGPSWRARLRVVGSWIRTTAGIAVTVAAAAACVSVMIRYTRTSPRFAVREVLVEGAGHRAVEEIARVSGIAAGQNVFAADLDAARARLLEDPWIERVTVTRRLPGTVRIEVVEREAVAMATIGADLYLVGREGEPFKRVEASDPRDLPVVTGVAADAVARDRAGAVATLRKALDLVAEYDRAGPARRLPVQEVHVRDDGAMALVVGREAIAVHVGRGPFRQPVEQAARVLAEIQARRAQACCVFADNEAHPERVVVRMR